MAEVRWSALARREIRAIIEYVADESVQGAREMRTRIDDAANQLKEYPLLGRVVPEFRDAAVRELMSEATGWCTGLTRTSSSL